MLADPPFLLLVDDDGPVVDALAFAFELEGFRVLACADATQALAADLPVGPGCLVLDLSLPDMDGLKLLELLRARGVETPAILITTHPTAQVRERARAQDVPIVEKPLITDALLQTVRKQLPGAA
jgi:FixJ family two-component response regulator